MYEQLPQKYLGTRGDVSLAMYETKFWHNDKKVCFGYAIHKCLDRLRGYLELFRL